MAVSYHKQIVSAKVKMKRLDLGREPSATVLSAQL
jgi:hypothetical protein